MYLGNKMWNQKMKARKEL